MKIRTSLLTVYLVCLAWLSHGQTAPAAGKAIHIAPFIDTLVIAEPLDNVINTGYKELGPMPTKDGTKIYFSRQGDPNNIGGVNDEDIWYSVFDDASQSWTKSVNIGAPLNNAGPNFVTGVGVKGDTLLLGNVYGKKGKMKSGVSISMMTGNQWSLPFPVKIAGDYNFSNKAGYDLSRDRATLTIAQEKADSNGKLDLYVAFRDRNPKNDYPYSGKESINMGPVINTAGNETSPWLAYDNKTLYFASDGHNGYGGLDIFVSKRLDDSWTNWSPPVNLGPGINSQYDDMSFNYNLQSRYAYYARGLTLSNADIYRVDMTYLFKNENTNLKAGENPVELGQTEVVKDVFEDNSSTLNPQSFKNFDYLFTYLKKFPEALVQISTHSNVHATRSESLQLSNQRAINVVAFLVQNGIAQQRLSYQGFGHDIVANLNPTSMKPAMNVSAMVEFKIVGFEGTDQK